jgi:hypothetical protein
MKNLKYRVTVTFVLMETRINSKVCAQQLTTACKLTCDFPGRTSRSTHENVAYGGTRIRLFVLLLIKSLTFEAE